MIFFYYLVRSNLNYFLKFAMINIVRPEIIILHRNFICDFFYKKVWITKNIWSKNTEVGLNDFGVAQSIAITFLIFGF